MPKFVEIILAAVIGAIVPIIGLSYFFGEWKSSVDENLKILPQLARQEKIDADYCLLLLQTKKIEAALGRKEYDGVIDKKILEKNTGIANLATQEAKIKEIESSIKNPSPEDNIDDLSKELLFGKEVFQEMHTAIEGIKRDIMDAEEVRSKSTKFLVEYEGRLTQINCDNLV